MGLFSAIGGALGFINNNQTASELAKDMSAGVDMMIYTKEEKAIDKIKATGVAMDTWLRIVETMKSSEVYRSVTRRFLAVFIVFNLFCMIWLAVFAECAATLGYFKLVVVEHGDLSFTPITWSILKIAGVFQLGWVFCTIIVFYFGPTLVQMMKKK